MAIVVGRQPFTVADDRDASAPPLYVLLPGDRCVTGDGGEGGDDLHLASTDATVQAVARRVGYESAFGLSVAFKRV